MNSIQVYDTTLRDGSQREGISLSVNDKLQIARLLDELGVDYIEGGWPGSNPKDMEFFARAPKELSLRHAKIVAFGSTRHAHVAIEHDANVRALMEAGTSVVTVVGKSWDFHVYHALDTTLDENLAMITDTISYLKGKGLEVIYDAEHFFDGFKENPDYAMATLRAAVQGGAEMLVLCDTNGGTMPLEVHDIILQVRGQVGQASLGIHTHNDAGMAVANSIIALQVGAIHVQGTINGYGERCGNADLVAIIANMHLKLKIEKFTAEQTKKLTAVSKMIYELANVRPIVGQPYVGRNAFTHKGGIHVDAVAKQTRTYEHADPEAVGNKRRILISELSGKSNILFKLQTKNFEMFRQFPQVKDVLQQIKKMEHEGYQFEGADGSFELLMWKAMRTHKPLFELEGFRVIVDKQRRGEDLYVEATIKARVGDRTIHTAAEGNGPVNAMDNALRKALEEFYPKLKSVNLVDYKVRVLEGRDGTAARVRVLIISQNGDKSWGTVGVSENIIEASWIALVDSIEYGLLYENSPSLDELKQALDELPWEEEEAGQAERDMVKEQGIVPTGTAPNMQGRG